MIMWHKRIMILLTAISAFGMAVFGQEVRKIDYDVALGFNIGATTPMGLPAEVRKIDSYKPTVNLSVGAVANYMLSPKWGIGAGLTFETKGMKTGIQVRNYHLTMNIEDGTEKGSKTGYFTGRIRNTTKMTYVTIPVNAIFRPNEDWEMEFGPYFSYALDRTFTGKVSDGEI